MQSLPNPCSQSQFRLAKGEQKLGYVVKDISYWCVFSAQTRRHSAAILKLLFILFHRRSHVCAPHGVHVPTCLHVEVLRRSVSTYAHASEVDSPAVLSQPKSEIFSLTVCPIGLKRAVLHSRDLFFHKVAPQKQEPSNAVCSTLSTSPVLTSSCKFPAVSPKHPQAFHRYRYRC